MKQCCVFGLLDVKKTLKLHIYGETPLLMVRVKKKDCVLILPSCAVCQANPSEQESA